jgi:hypothetical protein
MGYGGGTSVDKNTVGGIIIELVMDAVLKTTAESHQNYQYKDSPGHVEGCDKTPEFILFNSMKDFLPLIEIEHI